MSDDERVASDAPPRYSFFDSNCQMTNGRANCMVKATAAAMRDQITSFFNFPSAGSQKKCMLRNRGKQEKNNLVRKGFGAFLKKCKALKKC